MSKTVILLFHPSFKYSNANRTLINAAKSLPDLEIIDIYALYPNNEIDIQVEVNRLLSAERIILQFPIQWYSTPPLLKAWQDAVLTHMYYLAYETEGKLLEQKPILITATAGNIKNAYSPTGANLFSMHELLRPLQATAYRCKLTWHSPFILYETHQLDSTKQDQVANSYKDYIEQWRKDLPIMTQY